MTEFTDKDRILITRHDVKLGNLCSEVKELKENLKEDRGELKKDLEKIFLKLESSSTNCSLNRATCQKDMSKKFVAVGDKVDVKVGKFFTKGVLMWILLIIITSVISLGVFTGYLSTDVNVNKQRIVDMHPKGHT